eukprot:TRINITY_DN398_c0_g1_i4.p1 TRINITY_DN398_c0_g1~~TRINITY_DN398_c0_g1_i4.p1  ORF type:complete len:287 (+),score=51.82 TRINITY_DN398_c0_g1_i4:85-861(+)
MKVVPVPCLEDNYAYLIIDSLSGQAAVVDPVAPEKVVDGAKLHGAKIEAVLTTHHHWDHAGGNTEIKKLIPGLKVYGGEGEKAEGVTHVLRHEDTFALSESINVKALHTPCHTKGHISYYVTSSAGGDPAVFTGDTLFVAGCGKFFEGTAKQMYESLVTKLSTLPKETRVFCGHEYTVKNLQFAASLEPKNEDVQHKLEWALQQRRSNQPTVPSTIGEELETNPFMRVDTEPLQLASGRHDPVEVMAEVRRMKDQFKG